MTNRIDLRTVLTGLFLAAALMLASPGVHIARAGDDGEVLMSRAPAPQAVEAPACAADLAPQRTAAALAQARAALAEAHEDADVIVLNGRGFNYPAPSRVDPAGVEWEALQERRQP